MTVQLSSLRVFAEMDATKYVAGMNQKVAADKAGAASSQQVGNAVAANQNKMNASANRLARQYVDGFASAQRFTGAIGSLSRAIETGNVTMAQAEVILEGIYRKYGLMADAAQLAESGNYDLAQAVGSLNARLEMQEAAADGTTMAMTRMGVATRQQMQMSRQLSFQLIDIGQALATAPTMGIYSLQNLGFQFAQIGQLYMGQGGMRAALRDSISMVGRFAARIGPAIGLVAALGAAFAGMTYEINKTTDVSVGFVDVVKGTFQALGQVIYGVLQPAINAIAPWFAAAWNLVIDATKLVGNAIINSFRAAFEDVRFVWNQMPNMLGAVFVGAVNAVAAGTETMVNFAVAGINKLIAAVNGLPDWLKPEAMENIKPIGEFSIGRMENPAAGALGSAAAKHNARIQEIMSSDPLGEFFGMVRQNAIRNALADEKDKKGGGSKESDFERELRKLREETTELQQQNNVLDRSTFIKERNAAVQNLLNAAQRDGMPIGKEFANAQELIAASSESLSEKMRAQRQTILDAANAFATAKAEAEKLKMTQEAVNTAAGEAGGIFRGLIDGTLSWRDALLQAANVLLKLLNDMNKARGGSGLFGGGWLQSLLGGFLGIQFANGGVMDRGNVVPFARGGVVERPTVFPFANGIGLMGEAGPEAIMPLRRGPTGRLGVEAAAGSSAPQRVIVDLRGVFVDDNGVIKARVTSMGQQAAQAGASTAVDQVKRNLQGWSVQLSRDGAVA